MKPTFEQALWYLSQVYAELVRGRVSEATVVMDNIDPEYPQACPFTTYYGYPPHIPDSELGLFSLPRLCRPGRSCDQPR